MDPILYSSRITMSQSNTSASSGIPRRGLFVAGSNTDVGKTQVSVSILNSLVGVGEQQGVRRRVAAFKPVASGLKSIDDPKGDVFRLWNASSKDWPLDWSGDQCFLAPLAPPLAARIEQTNVDEPRMLKGVERWKDDCDFLLVEGAGGLLSPIGWSWTNADLAERLGYPIIIVVDNRLGAVNQALMTLEAAEVRGLVVRCIVLNDVTFSNDSGWVSIENCSNDSCRSRTEICRNDRCPRFFATPIANIDFRKVWTGFPWEGPKNGLPRRGSRIKLMLWFSVRFVFSILEFSCSPTL